MTEVVPVRGQVTGDWRPPWAQVMPDALRLAETVVDTEFVPRGLRGKAPAILAAIMYGHEIGLQPMQSLARIAVIDGRPTVSAETLRALVLAAGHEIWLVEATATKATMAGRRRGSQQMTEITFTMDDARRAGLAGKPNYRAYPQEMMVARATARLVRIMFPDVVGGMAAMEELDDVDAPADDADQPAAKAPTRSRARRTRVVAAPADEQTDPPAAAPETSGTPRQPDDEPPVDDLPLPESSEPSEPPQGPEPPPSTTPADVAADAAADAADAEAARAAREAQNIAAAEAMAQASEPQMMTDLQRPKLQALFREKGVTTREERLSYCSTIAGRKIESSNLLTIDEASRVIDALESWDPSDPKSPPFPPNVAPAKAGPTDDIPY